MQGTNPSRTVVDIAATVAKHQEIIPYLLAAHALSGCDTVAHMWGIGNGSIIKHLLKGSILTNVGNIASHLDDIIAESTKLCSGMLWMQSRCMDKCPKFDIKLGFQKLDEQNRQF